MQSEQILAEMKKISDFIGPKFRKSPLLGIHDLDKVRDDGSELKLLIHQI